jgi:hypothetical protein
MTKMLKEALERLSKLPDDEQDTIAALILAEIEDEKRWQESFAKSGALLDKLAREAREEDERGETVPGDW